MTLHKVRIILRKFLLQTAKLFEIIFTEFRQREMLAARTLPVNFKTNRSQSKFAAVWLE